MAIITTTTAINLENTNPLANSISFTLTALNGSGLASTGASG